MHLWAPTRNTYVVLAHESLSLEVAEQRCLVSSFLFAVVAQIAISFNELYDLRADPHETTNLIFEPRHKETIAKLNKRLFGLLDESNGLNLRLAPDRGPKFPNRHPKRSKPGQFPKAWMKNTE